MDLLTQPVGLLHYLVVGAVLFVAGVVCMVTKRNALGVLMGIELVLNGANVNFVAFSSPLGQGGAEQGLGLVILDYLQLMSGRGRFENRNQEISVLSRGLKMLAKELNVPVIVISQLSRAPEVRQGDHRPQLSDLRDSGAIEQDADLVCFLFREEMYKPEREDLKGLAELIVAKQRNGPTGIVNLVFLRQFTKFENRTADLEPGPPLAAEEDAGAPPF